MAKFVSQLLKIKLWISSQCCKNKTWNSSIDCEKIEFFFYQLGVKTPQNLPTSLKKTLWNSSVGCDPLFSMMFCDKIDFSGDHLTKFINFSHYIFMTEFPDRWLIFYKFQKIKSHPWICQLICKITWNLSIDLGKKLKICVLVAGKKSWIWMIFHSKKIANCINWSSEDITKFPRNWS